jgi:hypothetical protein
LKTVLLDLPAGWCDAAVAWQRQISLLDLPRNSPAPRAYFWILKGAGITGRRRARSALVWIEVAERSGDTACIFEKCVKKATITGCSKAPSPLRSASAVQRVKPAIQ